MLAREGTGASARQICLIAALAVVACAGVVLSYFGPARSACWDVAWTAAAASALGAMVLARRGSCEDNRARWTLWMLATGSWLAGQGAWDVFGLIGFPASPNVADFAWWGFAVLVIVSMSRTVTASRSVRVVAAVETLPLIVAGVALSLALLWIDAEGSSLALAPKLSALVYPALYVSAAIVTLQALIGGSLRNSVAAQLVLGGIVAQAVAFIVWSQELLNQSYVPGTTVLDPMWVLGLLAIAAGAALAARRPEACSVVEEPSRRGGVLPALVFMVLLAALVREWFTHGETEVQIALAVGLLFSGAALIIRSLLLELRLRVLLDRERAALASLAERETELARMNERLVEDSRRDALTGMGNRRALSDDLPRLEAAHREEQRPFALALCDVDHFKAYNDRLGHLAGDQALRAISAIVRGELRAGDMAYRFGGEEFLLVLQEATAPEALVVAERVRVAVEKAALPHPDGIGGVLTVSMGIATGTGDAGPLLAEADAALYEAKHGGRNRVAVASGEAAPAGRREHSAAAEAPVPRQLRTMLAVSRAAASGSGVMPVLEAVGKTIRSELSFQVVAINLLDRERAELDTVLVLGDDDARQTLLGTVSPWSEWEHLIDSQHTRCGAIWLPVGTYDWDETTTWKPAATAAYDPDAWDPDDMLLLPLRDSAGEILGIVSVDQPLTGRRPDDAELTVLTAVADHAGLAIEQAQRESAHAETSEQSQGLRLAAVMLLAETLDLRDEGTARHSRTVGRYARETALALGLAPERVERIHAAGVLHDLGKLGIADAILQKPGKLDDAEWKEMQRHPEIGARILEHAGMHDIAGWVRAHHERIDGRGYPDRLSAQEIPVEARILAVSDAYEAMVADRPYRAGMPAADAREELLRCAGSQFDPAVVEAFLRALAQTGETEDEQPLPVAA